LESALIYLAHFENDLFDQLGIIYVATVLLDVLGGLPFELDNLLSEGDIILIQSRFLEGGILEFTTGGLHGYVFLGTQDKRFHVFGTQSEVVKAGGGLWPNKRGFLMVDRACLYGVEVDAIKFKEID
jgi:hypothetical protein